MLNETGNGNLVEIREKLAANQKKTRDKQKEITQESSQLPPNAIANYVSLITEKGEKCIPIPLNDIVASIRIIPEIIKIAGMFYLKKDGKIQQLKEADDLFSALQELGKYVFFKQSVGFATKAEIFSCLTRQTDDYDGICKISTYPKNPRIYYDCEYIEPENTGAVDEFVGFFVPKTDYDKALIKAMLCSGAWSKGAGKKPIFLIQADQEIKNDHEKKNIGKSTLAHKIGKIFGGYVELNTGMDSDVVMRKLVRMADKRIALYDNVKTIGWSSEVLESQITAPTVQGHQMYVGHVEIENHFCYVVTVNDPAVSSDLASRSVPIIMTKPASQDVEWEDKIEAYITENRRRLFADIGYYIEQESENKKPATRFPVWERAILNIFVGQNDLTSHIKIAQTAINFELNTGFEDHLEQVLSEYAPGYMSTSYENEEWSPEDVNWWIPTNIIAKIYLEFSGNKNGRMGRYLAGRIKSELSKFTKWSVSDYRPRIKGVKQPRGYLLTKTSGTPQPRVYAPYNLPVHDRLLRSFNLSQ